MRRQVVAVGLTLVVIAVIGLLYLQALAQSRDTRRAWVTTRDLAAGSVIAPADVERVRIPDTGDPFTVLESSPIGRRAAHALSSGTLLVPDDLLGQDTVLVPLSLRAAPDLAAGDTLDVYALVGGQAVLVGRDVIVVATGDPLSVLVPASQEPYWIALQAGGVELYAARSSGAEVAPGGDVDVPTAIGQLAGAADGNAVSLPAPTPSPTMRRQP